MFLNICTSNQHGIKPMAILLILQISTDGPGLVGKYCTLQICQLNPQISHGWHGIYDLNEEWQLATKLNTFLTRTHWNICLSNMSVEITMSKPNMHLSTVLWSRNTNILKSYIRHEDFRLPFSVTLRGPPCILKWAGLESSGRIAYS